MQAQQHQVIPAQKQHRKIRPNPHRPILPDQDPVSTESVFLAAQLRAGRFNGPLGWIFRCQLRDFLESIFAFSRFQLCFFVFVF